ncbi:MAG: YgiT-type zinc finger protein [Xanthomonadales bacterium]|nr:YgiT-type zinc finger protein [Xanthomonadales bacterium]
MDVVAGTRVCALDWPARPGAVIRRVPGRSCRQCGERLLTAGCRGATCPISGTLARCFAACRAIFRSVGRTHARLSALHACGRWHSYSATTRPALTTHNVRRSSEPLSGR